MKLRRNLKPVKPKTAEGKNIFAAVLSAIIWATSFFLSFVLTGKSPYLWVPDALLLLGFAPLLFAWRPAWPFFVFGILNVLIGFVLELVKVMPDSDLPLEIQPVKHHLATMHVGIVWILSGAISIIYGAIRLTKNFVAKQIKKRA